MCCKDNHSSLGGSRFGFGVSVLMTGVARRHVERVHSKIHNQFITSKSVVFVDRLKIDSD